MEPIIKSLQLLFVLLFFCLAASAAPVKPTTVTLSSDPWPPYILGREGGAATHGIAVDILKYIFKKMNVELKLKLYPWARSIHVVKQGQHDGHILLTRSVQRSEYLVFSEPLFKMRALLWTRKKQDERISWQSFADLAPYSIALTHMYHYGEPFLAAIEQHQLRVVKASSDELNFKLLQGGRIDAFVCVETVARALFEQNKNFENRFVAADKPISEMSLMMSLRKNSAASMLMPEINRQIKILKNSGEFSQMINKYR